MIVTERPVKMPSDLSLSPSPFEPVAHESVADAVVDQIEVLIVNGVLKEGRRLPSERDLADQIKVSRPKIREALQRLENNGLITVRHGEGAFVSRLTGRAMSPALLALYSRHGAAFYDYLEYRKTQEAFAARLAAKRATEHDKSRLKRILDDMRTSWEEDDIEASREADMNLHSAIVDASQNTTLIHMMASIYDLTRQGVFYNRDFLRTIDGSGEILLEQHIVLASAILEGDAEAAERAALVHLDFVEESYRLWQERVRLEGFSHKRKILDDMDRALRGQ